MYEKWIHKQKEVNLPFVYKVFKWRSGVNFINILRALFLPISFCQKFMKPKCNRENRGKPLLYKKCTCKMLMKSSPDLCAFKARVLTLILKKFCEWITIDYFLFHKDFGVYLSYKALNEVISEGILICNATISI